MKIPSLSRLPRYKRFGFSPRYYDPVKEEIENRTQRIKSEMKEGSGYRHNIAKGFEGREKERGKTTIMQFVLVILFFAAILGYLYFGNTALYISGLLFVGYLYMRIRGGK